MKPKVFNLKLREPFRDPKRANHGFQKWAKRLRDERAQDQIRYADLQGLSTIGQDLPICSVCHGRSATWDGHPSCRGRR